MKRPGPMALSSVPLICSAALAQAVQVERNALIALYDSTNGAGWLDRENWRNGDDELYTLPVA